MAALHCGLLARSQAARLGEPSEVDPSHKGTKKDIPDLVCRATTGEYAGQYIGNIWAIGLVMKKQYCFLCVYYFLTDAEFLLRR